jgi:hypothetical protein
MISDRIIEAIKDLKRKMEGEKAATGTGETERVELETANSLEPPAAEVSRRQTGKSDFKP